MNEKSLTNRNIVVIGGTTGLGLSAAKAFAENGANVIVVGRNEESAEAAKNHLGVNAVALAGDAVKPQTAVRAIETCISQFGSFSGLYHVAGGSGRKMGDGPLHELTLEGWKQNPRTEPHLTDAFQPGGCETIFKTEHRRFGSEHGSSARLFTFATAICHSCIRSSQIGCYRVYKIHCSIVCKKQYQDKCNRPCAGGNTDGKKGCRR